MDLKLTNPSGQTVDLGNTTISGGLGTRTHTIYLSIDQGVRVLGSYVLNVGIIARVSLLGILQASVYSRTVVATFTVS